MNHLDEVREKYPQYKDWPDDELAEGLREKYYSDMSPSEYYKEINLPNPHAGIKGVGEDIVGGLKGAFPKAAEFAGAGATGLYDISGGNIPPSNSLSDHLKQLIGMKTQNERENEYSPERFAKVIGSSLLKGGRGLLNVPGNIVDYAHEKELAPEWLQAARPNEATQNADYDEIVGLEGERPGDIIPGAAGMIPALVASGGNPYAAIGVQSIGENENPIENVLAGKILQSGAKHAPKAASAIPKAIGKVPQVAKSLTDKITPERYSKTKTLNKAANIVEDTLSDITKDYNSALKDPRLPDKVTVNLDESLVSDFKKGAPGFITNVEKAIESGKISDLHQAATDLGDYERGVKERKTKASPKNQQTAIVAGKLRAQIEKIIDKTLDRYPGLKDTYRNADIKYKEFKETVPIALEKALKKYKKGKLLAKDAAREFNPKAAAEFRKKYEFELPGIQTAPYDISPLNVPLVRHGANFVEKYLGGKK